MKIVCISASKIPSEAANSLQAMKAAHALAQLGHDVTLIAPSTGQAPPKWDTLCTFYGLRTPFDLQLLQASSRRLFFYSAVRRARTLNPALLYVWPLQSAVFGLMHGLPVILEMHDLPSGLVGPLWYRIFLGRAGRKRVTVITTALKQALDAKYGQRLPAEDVVLAPNGVELERFEELPNPSVARRSLGLPEAETVVCTGHLYQGRGVDLFLNLAFRLRGVRFLWVGGRAEDVEKARAQVKSKGLSNVTFTGFIHNAQLPMYQAAAEILLMPYGQEIGISSGDGNSAAISSPMKMFEYLATGRAIVVSDLLVFHEVLNEKNAVFCPPDNVNMWEGALRALLDDSLGRAFLAKQARTDAAKYCWTERAKRILSGFVEREG